MLFFLFDVGGKLPWGVETLLNITTLLVAGAGALLWRFQNRLIYMSSMPPGSRTVVARPDRAQMPDFEDATIRTPDGVRIRAYAVFTRVGGGATTAAAAAGDGEVEGEEGLRRRRAAKVGGGGAVSPYTILYLHANAGNMGHRLPIARVLQVTLNCNIVLLSYRGYGLSEGVASEAGIKVDAAAALEWIGRHAVLGGTRVVVYGQSIGGAGGDRFGEPVSGEGARGDCREYVFEFAPPHPHVMPFLTYVTFLCHQKWDSATSIARIDRATPMLLLSGGRDELIPQSHMLELLRIARSSRRGEAVGPYRSASSSAGAKKGSVPERDADGVRWEEFAAGGHNDTCVQPGYFERIGEFWRDKVESGAGAGPGEKQGEKGGAE
ncbi:Alpha/Beta hydrolase protein [Zopfochytrium polystomum]|nr:Alpha/Beta hydrolase protein [Zopfochytrium polystomum]